MEIIYRILTITGLLVGSVAAQTVYYSENFEGTVPPVGMTQSGGWEFGTPTKVGPASAYEGSKCAGTDLDSTYIDNGNYVLTTPSITLPTASVIKLSFYEWYLTESGWDYLYLEIEKNGSGSWTTLRPEISGSATTWSNASYDLSNYKNSSIKIRFTLTSDHSNVRPGWYIDQIQVYTPVIKSLTVNNSGSGSTSPNGTVSIETNTPYSISATPNTGNRFSNWTVQSGTATFTDPNAQSTTVQITGDATIRANFISGTVYPISSTATQYNYTTHYYDVSPSNGVRFKFTAPAAGSYAVTIQNVQSHSNNLYYYGRDSLFNSYIDNKSNGSSASISFYAANAGETYWFKVVPYSSSYYTYDFNISYTNALSLAILINGNGTTSPSGTIGILSGESKSITATPSSGYRFDNWTVVSGSPVISSSTSKSTTVQTTDNAAIRANFSAGTVYPLTSTATVYNFTTNNYEIDPSYGVRFQFTAPAAGNYTVVVDSSYKYLYDYGTSSTFSSYVNYTYGSSRITYNFTSSAGAVHYFMITPYSSSYYTNNFAASVVPADTLTLSTNGFGTVSPSSPVVIPSGIPYTISASPSSGYRFSNWAVQSGSATIASSSSQSTTVQITTNTAVKANFIPGTVYPVTLTPTQYNYTTNYFDVSPSNGVRFKFTAPAAGGYAVTIQNIQSHSNYIYYYGRDSLFNSLVDSKGNSSSASISFYAANAGETYWFKVVPYSSSYYTYDFNISYTNALSLAILINGNGTTSPSGTIGILSGESKSITATPSSGYRFDNWTVVSGSPVISSSTSKSTTVQTTDNAAIRANFSAGTVYPLSPTPTVYNFTTNNYEVDPSYGVRFRFTAPSAGYYGVIIDSSYKYFYDYGRDSLFSTVKDSRTGSSRIIYSFSASSAGENHYFKVRPYSSSYYASNFVISVARPTILVVTNDGRGITFPSGTIPIFSGIDTVLTAVPKGGNRFSRWSVLQGNAIVSRVDSAVTHITSTSDTVVVKASFAIDPNTRPHVEITDLNISSHPDICLTASVTDSAGRSIAGLDSSQFVLTQDSDMLDYQLTTVSKVAGVSVALVIDRSASMSGTLNSAKDAALQYVNTMGPLDRCAIITFDDTVHVQYPATGNTYLLDSAINAIALGGNTAIKDGAYKGVQQLLQETNTRAVIIYSDGADNSSTISMQTAINLARQNNVKIYSIGLGSSASTSTLKPLADSTGGYYSYAPSVSDLARIYAQIKSDVEAQYILCYQSPDAVFNGDTHTVVLSVNINNHIDKDTVYWNESNMPPVITLTTATNAKIGVNQPSGQALTISADVTDDGSVDTVRLFYRKSSITVSAYTEIPMTHTSGNTYQAIIPAGKVLYPGIDFYILATDNYHLIGRSPNVLTPELQPYVIPVANEVPVISYSPGGCLSSGQNDSLTANITDNDGTFYAVLYYKKSTETFYSVDTMRELSTDNYTGVIPISMITPDGIDYYIRAVDNVGAAARYPHAGYLSLSYCNNHAPTASAGPDRTLYVQNGCTVSATLNGTGSSDPDGDPLTFAWTGPFTGTLTGSSPSANLSIGSNSIILKVSDGNGHSDDDTVVITVRDTIHPVPTVASLPDIKEQCHATVSKPTATDNCAANITATTTDPLVYDSQGPHVVHWIYDDGHGNITTQQQNVIIKDSIPPVPLVSSLPTLKGLCSVNLTVPQAQDGCAGTIDGVTSSPMTIDQQGTHDVIWSYNDGNGNISTQIQHVIIKDSIPPRLSIPHDTVVLISALSQSAFIIIDSANGHDSCSEVTIGAVRSDGLVLDSAFKIGTTHITWKACDNNGNCDSSIQTVTVRKNHMPQLVLPSDRIMNEGEYLTLSATASDSDGTTPKISLVNSESFISLTQKNNNDTGSITCSPGCADHGQYAVKVQVSDGIDSTSSEFNLQVVDINFAPVFDSIEKIQKAVEQQPFSLDVRVRDCDGSIPNIRIINAPQGAVFDDKHDGHGTFTWTPGGNDNGYYVIIFETGDGTTTVRDTIVIEVKDVNCYKPVLELSSTAVTASVHLPITILATGSDQDGIPPLLRTSALPTGAHFSTDDNGTGVFTWTPNDTGRYTFIISALDINDTTVKVGDTVTIIVNGNNVTGPVFTHRNDTTINQNSEMILHIEAHDPDGTIPSLFLISGPPGIKVADNKDCTGSIVWSPDCETSGKFSVKVGAADQSLSDTLTLNINVRDVNCAPVLNHISDVSAKPGELVRIQVSAFDPDNDGTIPTLSAVCNSISGYTFVTTGNAIAEFKCVAPGSQGIYPVTFYASDGFLVDSEKMFISINEFGYVKISCKQKGAGIFAMPAGSYSGTSLGTDSITYKAPLGTYWFEVRADGYRARRISCDVELNDTISKIVDLKPSIPLMLTSPETLSLGSGVTLPQSGSISFVDLNGDGIEDLTVTSINGGAFYSGLDSINNGSYHSQPSGFGNLATGLKPLHHAFVDWNNDGLYECVLSDKFGNIVVVKQNGSIDTLIKITGEKLYTTVYDIDKDGKKDLLVNSEGHGLFKYINNGTDAVPAFKYGDECTDQSGQSLRDLKGAPVLFDLDNDGREEMVILSNGVLKVFKIDSSFSVLTFKEDLNCVGKRVTADSLSMALIGPSRGAPKLAIYINDKILIYPTHLLGDVNHDSVVNILDISKISRQMDYNENDPGYTPAYNLRLSDTGEEIINIRDISRASKCFDMKE